MTGKAVFFKKKEESIFPLTLFEISVKEKIFHHRYFKKYVLKNWFFIVFEKYIFFQSYFLELSEKNTFYFSYFYIIGIFIFITLTNQNVEKEHIFLTTSAHSAPFGFFREHLDVARIVFSANSAQFKHCIFVFVASELISVAL